MAQLHTDAAKAFINSIPSANDLFVLDTSSVIRAIESKTSED